MKKIIIFLLSSMFFFSQASAVGLNVGFSANGAVFHGTAEENENGEKSSEDATGAAAYASFFIEASVNDRLGIGVDYVPESLESDTVKSVVDDITTSTTNTRKTQSVQVDFNDLTTAYIRLGLTQGLYAKVGYVTVDVATNESLATGSTYADTDMSGHMYGLGYHMETDGGVFVRLEASIMELDGVSVTASNTDNKVTIDGIDGLGARVSIGKSF